MNYQTIYKLDKTGKYVACFLSVITICFTFWIFGYRLADALYEPAISQHKEEFANGTPSDILLKSNGSVILDEIQTKSHGSLQKPVENDKGSMGSIPQENNYIQPGESDVETYSAEDLQILGEIYDGDLCYKWYSQQVLPGEGLDIPGRYVDDEGYIRDEEGNLCVASNRFPLGTQIEVPFGDGYAVVYDTYEDEEDDLIDVYTDW